MFKKYKKVHIIRKGELPCVKVYERVFLFFWMDVGTEFATKEDAENFIIRKRWEE